MESITADYHDQINDFNSLECRACLKTFNNVIDLYNLFEDWPISWTGMSCTIADDLSKLAQIQIIKEEKMTNLICLRCSITLQKACMFMNLVQSSELKLRQRNSGTSCISPLNLPRPIQMESFGKLVDIPYIKEEVVSDEEKENNAQNSNEPLIDEIKVEPEELIQPMYCQQVNGMDKVVVLNPERESKDQTSSDAVLDIKVEPEELLKPVSWMYANGQNSDDSATESPFVKCEESYLKEAVKQPNSEALLHCSEEDQPFKIPLQCILCLKKCKTMTGLKQHVMAIHSYKNIYRTFDKPPPSRNDSKHNICSSCGTSFTTSKDLIDQEKCDNQLLCHKCKATVTKVVKPKNLKGEKGAT